MAPKPHGKEPAKSTKSPDTPKLLPDHLLVPFGPPSQTSTSNRFQLLGNPSQPSQKVRPSSSALALTSQYGKPTYSALASLPPSQPPNPYEIIETMSPAQSPLRLPSTAQSPSRLQSKIPYVPKNPSDFIVKEILQNVFHVDHCHRRLITPEVTPSQKDQEALLRVQHGKLLRAYLPPKWHFVPQHPNKSIGFYKVILLHTESVKIEPIMDRFDPTQKRIAFHKLFIIKILSNQEWGSHPSILKELPGQPIGFNYYDYIEAWTNVLLYQNENFSHSWFLNFDNKFTSQLPMWFLRWWQLFGPITDIIPTKLKEAIARFGNLAQVTVQNSQFPTLCLFTSKYKIPWILKWDYQVNQNIMARRFQVKWWDKFNIDRIIEQVKKEFPQPEEFSAVSQFLVEKTSLQTALVSAMNQVQSKEDLQELCHQLQLEVSKISGQDPDEHSPASSHSSAAGQSKPNYLDPVFQDSQDPYAFDLGDDM
jgi:hypothetical protein